MTAPRMRACVDRLSSPGGSRSSSRTSRPRANNMAVAAPATRAPDDDHVVAVDPVGLMMRSSCDADAVA